MQLHSNILYADLKLIFLWSISSVPVGMSMTTITFPDMRSIPFCLMDCSVMLLRMLGSIFFPPLSTAQVVSSSWFVLQKSAHIDCRFVALFFLHLVSGRCTTKPSWRSCWGTGCTWTPPTPSSSPPSSWSSSLALAGSLPWRRSSAFSSPTSSSSSSSPSSPWSAGFSLMSSESRSSLRLCTNHLDCSSLFSKVAWTMKAEMVTEVRNYLPDQPKAPVTR